MTKQTCYQFVGAPQDYPPGREVTYVDPAGRFSVTCRVLSVHGTTVYCVPIAPERPL